MLQSLRSSSCQVKSTSRRCCRVFRSNALIWTCNSCISMRMNSHGRSQSNISQDISLILENRNNNLLNNNNNNHSSNNRQRILMLISFHSNHLEIIQIHSAGNDKINNSNSSNILRGPIFLVQLTLQRESKRGYKRAWSLKQTH